MNQNACVFCNNPLKLIDGHSAKGVFTLYICENCIPNHTTEYKQLYFVNGLVLLSEAITIDEYYITRHYEKTITNGAKEQTIISKFNYDCQSIVCGFDYILNLNFNDIDALKKKLDIYTTFS